VARRGADGHANGGDAAGQAGQTPGATRRITPTGRPAARGHVERNRRPYDTVLDTIGWTPLIRLNRVTRGIVTPVYGKAEYFNPGGSVKDRIGMPIIEQAEREGTLKPGGTIVEGTSGNTGVGLAIAAALKGYKCIFTMPDKMTRLRPPMRNRNPAETSVPMRVPNCCSSVWRFWRVFDCSEVSTWSNCTGSVPCWIGNV